MHSASLTPLALFPILLPNAQAQGEWQVSGGATVNLFAESPGLFNPTAIDVDDAGRVWVAEGVNYRQWDGRNPGRHHDGGDRIVVLEDKDGDGRAESSSVYVQDPDLTAPLGILVAPEGVYVSCSPNLFLYHDDDGDGKADRREVFLTGFGGHDHDHGLHSVVAYPGGGLLWCAGNAGPHVVRDSAGFVLRSGSVYNGGGASHPGNQPGLRSDDGRVWTGGLIGRLWRDGSGVAVLAHNFRNPYEVAVDVFGDMYTYDNDDDGNQGCRMVALTPGGDYGYFGDGGRTWWNADRREGLSTQEAHWHQGDPGVMPMGTVTGAGGPTGVTVYENPAWPAMQGRVLAADAGRGLIWAARTVERGAELALEPEVWLQPKPGSDGQVPRTFRPSDVAVGPDGAVYVADWFDPGVGGHHAADHDAYGRILRIVPPAERGTSDYDVEARLAQTIWWDLPPADNQPALPRFFEKTGDAALKHPSPRVRLTMLRALESRFYPVEWFAPFFWSDRSPRVRAHLACALRDLDWEKGGTALTLLAMNWDGRDRAYLEAIGIGAEGKERELYLALLEQLSGSEDRERLLHFAWRLHPEESLSLFRSWLEQGGAALPLRRLALDGVAQLPSREAAEYMAGQALAGAEDLRGYAAEWVRQRATGRWSGYGLESAFEGDFANAEALWTSELVTTEGGEFEVSCAGLKTLWLVVEDGGNGNGYDWAAWIEPHWVTDAGEVPLQKAGWVQAEAGWGQARWDKSADGRALKVAGQVRRGIGTHAASRISFAVPSGAKVLRAGFAPDDGGLQGDRTPSIRFAVYGERGEDPAAQAAVRSAWRAGNAEALAELLASDAGSQFLLQSVREGSVPAALADATRKGLLAHSDWAVRALAEPLFKAAEPAYPDWPSDWSHVRGDATRGRELFQGRGTCMVCHTYEGRGGIIGPDLSSIAGKLGAQGLREAIQYPSRALAFGYDHWTVTKTDGSVLAGALLAGGDTLVLRDLTGKRHAVPREQVTSMEKSPVSVMPAAATIGLSPQDLADVVAFLGTEKKPEPTFGRVQDLFPSADFAGWNFFLNDGGQRDDVWSVRDGILRCEGRPMGYLYTQRSFTDFELIVEWRFDPAVGGGNSGVLLRVQPPHKTWPRSIEAQLQSKSAGDIWNIDEFPMQTDPTRTEGRHTVKLLPTNERPLGEWNHYRIRLDGSDLTLEVNGEIQNTATWCAPLPGPIALQSEGVPIEFRRIELREIVPE